MADGYDDDAGMRVASLGDAVFNDLFGEWVEFDDGDVLRVLGAELTGPEARMLAGAAAVYAHYLMDVGIGAVPWSRRETPLLFLSDEVPSVGYGRGGGGGGCKPTQNSDQAVQATRPLLDELEELLAAHAFVAIGGGREPTLLEVVEHLPRDLCGPAGLLEYEVGPEDPRVPLRGQTGVWSQHHITRGEMLGTYRGRHQFDRTLKARQKSSDWTPPAW